MLACKMFHSLSLVLVLFLRFFEPIEQHPYLQIRYSFIYFDTENKSKPVVAYAYWNRTLFKLLDRLLPVNIDLFRCREEYLNIILNQYCWWKMYLLGRHLMRLSQTEKETETKDHFVELSCPRAKLTDPTWHRNQDWYFNQKCV